MPRDDQGQARRDRAKILVRVLARYEKIFRDADRRADPVDPVELQMLDNLAGEALALLGENTVVLPMITDLQMTARLDAKQSSKRVTFDLAYRRIGPILGAVEAAYSVSGGSVPAAKSGRSSPVVAWVDDDHS